MSPRDRRLIFGLWIFLLLAGPAWCGTPAAAPFAVAVVASDDAALPAPAPRDQELGPDAVLAMVRRAVDLVGGMAAVVPDTARLVVIKPNVVAAVEPGSGITTDPQVVRAVALLVHEVAPEARLLIAEGSGGWASPDQAEAAGVTMPFWARWFLDVDQDGFEVGGYRAVAAELRGRGLVIDCLDLNFDRTVTLTVPGGGLAMPDYDLAATVLEADAWINCPVMKTHGSKITCCMKNHIGLLPGRIYGFSKDRGTERHRGIVHVPGLIDELLVDLWILARVDLNVVDGIVGREAGGLQSGLPLRDNLVLAGRDAVATDLVAARLMGFNPDDMEFAELARQRGLGPGSIRAVEVRGGEVARLSRRFKKAGRAYSRGSGWREHADYGMGPRYWSLLGPLPAGHAFAAEEIATLAPVPGERGWSPPVYFYHDVIDLDRQLEDPRDCTVYAFTRFAMPETAEVRLWVGSDEDLTVWIDGSEVYRFAGRRIHHLGQERLPLRVEAGEHRLLVRAAQSRGRFAFSFNLCEPIEDEDFAGNRYPGVTWWTGGPERY